MFKNIFKTLLHKTISKFESNYNYDASYMHDINKVSPGATFRLMLLSPMSNFQGPDKHIWGGSALAATLYGDCGPCAQLAIDRLLEQGLDQNQLKACLQHNWSMAGETGLGYRFADAVHQNDANLESLRDEIRENYGEQAVIAASFAAVSYPVYPLLKRALGSAKACQSLVVGEHQNVKVGRSL